MGSLVLMRRSSQSSLKTFALTAASRFLSANPQSAPNAAFEARIHTCTAGSVLPKDSPGVGFPRSFHSGQTLRAGFAVADYSDGESASSGPADEGLAISKLDISPQIVSALKNRGIENLFPIQRAVLEPAMAGRDMIGRARTGTGKTLAFGIPIMDKIIKFNKKHGSKHQTMMFSATMPNWILKLTQKFLKSPVTVDLVGESDQKLADGITLYSIVSDMRQKPAILGPLITEHAKGGKCIVFTQTKRDADRLAYAMQRNFKCEPLHGDITQNQRERTLSAFREGRINILVATDVAARGLDVPNVDLVVHYELPNSSENFVHRSGRTGRAGKKGSAVLIYSDHQYREIKAIERELPKIAVGDDALSMYNAMDQGGRSGFGGSSRGNGRFGDSGFGRSGGFGDSRGGRSDGYFGSSGGYGGSGGGHIGSGGEFGGQGSGKSSGFGSSRSGGFGDFGGSSLSDGFGGLGGSFRNNDSRRSGGFGFGSDRSGSSGSRFDGNDGNSDGFF
ncbi:hypothetical protein SASPL_113005 [Salvia splendens]|uniref:Helicase C-terminal domain-containing protein n=1 Tax=Salvia splendens TaxID=180675 RepID=A0A8X8Y374_SALSN|nr:hypothetical protein SASPL_113005 [Salvia splendens]